MESKALTGGNKWTASATSGTQLLVEQPFVMPFAPGQIVGRKYEIIELIGVGGVGYVVAANHIELGEKVALKFLKPEMLVNPEVVGRFAHEALAAVRIKSEHVARVFDVGSMPDETPFIVMEFLDGRDLFDVIAQEGPQPIRRSIDYVLQACEALADAHACGVVHRDIKPENLFLLQRSGGIELIKVLDFGISKLALTGSAAKSKVPLVQTMLPMGSPVYMSPEQIRASKDIDCRTDIWSMGCVLYELLTGSAAFDAPSLTQLSATILEQDPPAPSFGRPEIPAELDAIVSRCLEKSAARRYQNVAELAMALYPYGPRRARVSAERCCMLLKVPGASHAEFELPSVKPPTWDGLPSGAFPVSQELVAPTAAASVVSEQAYPVRRSFRNARWALIIGCSLAAIAFATAIANRGKLRSTWPSNVVGSLTNGASATVVPSPGREHATKPPEPIKASASSERQSGTTSIAPSSAVTAAAIPVAQLPVVTSAPAARRTLARPVRTKKSGTVSSSNADPDPGF
jgi:eukaryotic-like serine/threonine-protein kinase